MLFRLTDLHLILVYFKGQDYGHFDCKYLVNGYRYIYKHLQSNGSINTVRADFCQLSWKPRWSGSCLLTVRLPLSGDPAIKLLINDASRWWPGWCTMRSAAPLVRGPARSLHALSRGFP